MLSIVYQITMQTGFALAVDPRNPNPGGQLILRDRSGSDPYQLWQLLYYPPTKASILRNPRSGLCAYPKSNADAAPVVLFEVPGNLAFNVDNTWQLNRDGPYAVQTAGTNTYVLNALGNTWADGTPVGVFPWSGGQTNELWNFIPQSV
jgi:hypothetical protein